MRKPAIFLSVAMAAAVWSGVFDLYVSRGAREYLQKQAEFELGRGPEPSMADVMREARTSGVIAASLWATAVASGGWGMFALGHRRGGAGRVRTLTD